MPKVVELRQDRNLIRRNFDGYKLSLETVPIIQDDLKSAPLKAEPSDDQFSFLHVEMFSMQNLLVSDPWQRTVSYFINRLGEVVRAAYDESTGSRKPMQPVFRIGVNVGVRAKGVYNFSMKFLSEKYCLLCDGINELVLLDTGDRIKATEWKKVTSCEISKDEKHFLLYDCRLDIVDEKKIISCALGRVHQSKKDSYALHLHWGKLTQDTTVGIWSFSILDTIVGNGSIYYCAFEPRAEALVVSSNKLLRFRSKIITEQQQLVVVESKVPQVSDEQNQELPKFTWSQTHDDIVLKFNIIEGKDKSDYKIQCAANKLSVMCNEESLLEKELFAKVDQDLTTWTLENNFLQITLIKEVSSIPWPILLADGSGPKESTEDGGESCIQMENQPIANLEAPVEDCDFPMGTMEDEIKIERFHLPSRESTHQVLLSTTPPLFATSIRPGFPQAIVTRQDVDACVWLQQYNPSKPDDWSLRHEGSLHAFGYVQASKQQKKFMDCSPDLDYAIIAESHRHVFLYKSNYDTAHGLRNRSGPQVTIGKQHLITLEDVGEVLGIATDVSVVTMLTEKCVLYFQIN